jgi:hypothetical protein
MIDVNKIKLTVELDAENIRKVQRVLANHIRFCRVTTMDGQVVVILHGQPSKKGMARQERIYSRLFSTADIVLSCFSSYYSDQLKQKVPQHLCVSSEIHLGVYQQNGHMYMAAANI